MITTLPRGNSDNSVMEFNDWLTTATLALYRASHCVTVSLMDDAALLAVLFC